MLEMSEFVNKQNKKNPSSESKSVVSVHHTQADSVFSQQKERLRQKEASLPSN